MAVDISTLSGGVRAAYIALVKSKVAGALGLQPEAVKFFEESYERKLQRARIEDLELAASSDQVAKEVIAAIRAPFGMDDPKLPIAMDTLFSRVDAVRAAAFAEVRDAHSWAWLASDPAATREEAMDGLARAAFITLITEKLAIPCGLDTNTAQLLAQKYQTQIARAITADVNGAAESVDDALAKSVLASIRAVYGMDDTKVPRSIGGLVQRVEAVKTNVLEEIKAAYPWTGVTGAGTWEDLPGLVKAAYVSAVAASVAVGLGLDTQTAATLEQKKILHLSQAKKNELDTALSQNTDPVLAQLIANFRTDDTGLVSAYAIYTQRAAAVKSDSDATVRDILALGSGALTGAAKDASTALSVAKLAPVCGLDGNFAALKEQEFNALIAESRKNALEKDIALGEASTGEMKKACDEVRATLEIPKATPLDTLALAAAASLCHTRQAVRAGYDANFLQLKEQEYTAKIQEWRKIALNRSLAQNNDPILAELLANFRSDDPGLVNAYAIYTQRVEAVKLSAYCEIERSHNWRWISSAWTATTPLDEKIAAMDGLTRSAYITLASKLIAVSCGITPEMTQVYEQQYQTRLRLARVADLETTEITDPVQNEVLSLIRSTFANEKALPRDMKTLTDKIDALKDMARKEVLAAHDWSFAQHDYTCDSALTEHPDEIFPYHVTLPKGALLVSACYGTDGKVAQWKLRGREIHAQSRIVRVVYIKDVADYTVWHPKAYRAFILRLVADVAKCVAESPKERTLQEQLYRDALEEAQTCDARCSNTPDEAWGDNDIADTMLHGYDRRPYDDPLFRD